MGKLLMNGILANNTTYHLKKITSLYEYMMSHVRVGAFHNRKAWEQGRDSYN